MPKKSPESKRQRLPAAVGGINVNFCRNPYCDNFGKPDDPDAVVRRGRPRQGEVVAKRRYKLSADGKNTPVIQCQSCGHSTRVKSNFGVLAEFRRLRAALIPDHGPARHKLLCPHVGVGAFARPELFVSNGTAPDGAARVMCRTCRVTASIGKSTAKQKLPHKNREILRLLLNGVAMRRVAKIAGVDNKTVYDKIAFLHRQCIAFVADRERHLLKMQLPKLRLCSDKQDYYVNWSHKEDFSNTRLTAAGTADLDTGYVFAMSLNYTCDVDTTKLVDETNRLGEAGLSPPYRRHGHYWHPDDLQAAKGRESHPSLPAKGVMAKVVRDALDTERRGREEMIEGHRGLPVKGAQIRQEYTAYGQFLLLLGLLDRSPHITLYLDQDSDLRSAALAIFQLRIRSRTADVAYVKINKVFTNQEKVKKVQQGIRLMQLAKKLLPDKTDNEIRLMVMQRRIERRVGVVVSPYDDLWIRYPFPRKNEPEKAVALLTEYSADPIDRRAKLCLGASLHAVDRFFMQVRRGISLVERPIASAANARRTWQGKNAYSPEVVRKLLEMFRVYFNYVEVGEDGMTPAMRLGLAKGPVRDEDIIYFSPEVPSFKKRRRETENRVDRTDGEPTPIPPVVPPNITWLHEACNKRFAA